MPRSKDGIKFLDKLMADNKWRSEKQMLRTLVEARSQQALEQIRQQSGNDLKDWLRERITYEDNGLRCKGFSRFSDGREVRYVYWCIVPPEKRWEGAGASWPDLTREEALAVEVERGLKAKQEREAKEAARYAGDQTD